MRRLFGLLLALTLLVGCAPGVQGGYVLYYLKNDKECSGSALAALSCRPPEEESITPEFLLQALFSGTEAKGFASPFPKGVRLEELSWDENTPKMLYVTVSERYDSLSDIGLTLADYCIVLTLAQLEDAERVGIRTVGQNSAYRIYSAVDSGAMLEDTTVTAMLDKTAG